MPSGFENLVENEKGRKPFSDITEQTFLLHWCETNGLPEPNFVPKKDWTIEGLTEGIRGDVQLLMPLDLKLIEIPKIVQSIDEITIQKSETGRLKQIVNYFKNSAVYILQHLKEINQEYKSLATSTARQFYEYGSGLETGMEQKKISENVSNHHLTPKEETDVEDWLLGKFKKQIIDNHLIDVPVKNNHELLSFFFQVLSADKHQNLYSPVSRVQSVIEDQIRMTINEPEEVLYTTLFNRGLSRILEEKRISNVCTFYPNIPREPTKLVDLLQVDKLKKELGTIRETKNTDKIMEKEKIVIQLIKSAVNRYFRYEREVFDPDRIVNTNAFNCVGFSIVGNTLLQEVGIKCLHAGSAGHSQLVVVTADGRYHYCDMQKRLLGKEITKDVARFKESDFRSGVSFYDEELGIVELAEASVGLQVSIIQWIIGTYGYGNDAFERLAKKRIKNLIPGIISE